MKLPEDVFVTDGFPEFTYVPLASGEKETEFLEGLAQRNKIISISGPSKSGKTTLCKHVIENKTDYTLIYITGDSLTSASDLWHEAVKQVVDDTEKNSFDLSHSERIARLVQSNAALVIDDFHYIPKDFQATVCRQIKNAASAGLRIICLTVPHRGDDAVRGNGDLSGRFFSVDFDYWADADLLQIASKGFHECGYSVPDNFASSLASEALRSPQIMQTLCLETCRSLEPDQAVFDTNFDDTLLVKVRQKALRSYNRQTDLQLLRQGSPTRGSERKRYTAISGEDWDIYQILVQALKANPPFLALSLDDVRTRVAAVLQGDRPDNIRSALQQYNDLFESGQPPLDWDDEKRSLTIVDPHFYLRNNED